jgi:hypothetical protein
MPGIIERLRNLLSGAEDVRPVEEELGLEVGQERLDELHHGSAIDSIGAPGGRRDDPPDPDPRLDGR